MEAKFIRENSQDLEKFFQDYAVEYHYNRDKPSLPLILQFNNSDFKFFALPNQASSYRGVIGKHDPDPLFLYIKDTSDISIRSALNVNILEPDTLYYTNAVKHIILNNPYTMETLVLRLDKEHKIVTISGEFIQIANIAIKRNIGSNSYNMLVYLDGYQVLQPHGEDLVE